MKRIVLEGVVGWEFDSTTVREALDLCNGEDIEVEINSPGGSVYEIAPIFNLLKGYPGHVTTMMNGLAASAASVIFLAGDERKALEGSLYMIHNAASFCFGFYQKEDLSDVARVLDVFDANIAYFYDKYTNIDDPKQRMTEETWFTTKDMLESGIVSEIIDASEMNKDIPDTIQIEDEEECIAMTNKIRDTFMKANAALFKTEEPAETTAQAAQPMDTSDEADADISEIAKLTASLAEFSTNIATQMQSFKDDFATMRNELAQEKEDFEQERTAMKDEMATFKAEKEAAVEEREKVVKEKEKKIDNYFPSQAETTEKIGVNFNGKT